MQCRHTPRHLPLERQPAAVTVGAARRCHQQPCGEHVGVATAPLMVAHRQPRCIRWVDTGNTRVRKTYGQSVLFRLWIGAHSQAGACVSCVSIDRPGPRTERRVSEELQAILGALAISPCPPDAETSAAKHQGASARFDLGVTPTVTCVCSPSGDWCFCFWSSAPGAIVGFAHKLCVVQTPRRQLAAVD